MRQKSKKTVIVYFDPTVIQEIKIMAANHDKTIQELIAEGINEAPVK